MAQGEAPALPPPPEGEESDWGDDAALSGYSTDRLYGYLADWLFGDDHAASAGVFEPGWAVDWGVEELSSLGWRVGVNKEAVAVDHDVVVEPAHRRQVLRVRPPTIDPPCEVMYLEAVAAGAACNGAGWPVTIQDEAA